jgi:[acyl-carrier-protein] S-malonyltransferase
VQTLVADGIDVFVELGSGGVLAGLIKRIDPGVRALSIGTPAELSSAMEVMAGGS